MRFTHLRVPGLALFIILFLSLAACAAKETHPALAPTVDASPATPTATIQWFPATATPSPQILHIATTSPLPPPGIGRTLITDDFSSAGAWNTIETNGSSVIVNRNRITIAIKEPKSYIFSLRNEPTLADFYAEIDAHAALCKGNDSYGFVFHSDGKKSYRYALDCNGTVRFELRKIYNRPRVIQVPLPSRDAPPGSPGDVRLGVWIAGTEMRFYLNGRYQFSVVDTQLREAGTIGVFAETAPENSAMTVTFSNLVLQSVGYISPTPTITPTKTPVPTSTEKK